MTCLRIGSKLQTERYEVEKCDRQSVNNRKALFFCNGKTKLSSRSDMYTCINGHWKSNNTDDVGLPTCKATCPELFYKTESTIVKDQNGKVVRNDERVVAGTKIIASCRKNYDFPKIFHNDSEPECLESGEWKGKIIECVRREIQNNLLPLSFKGDKVENIAEYPWHVGIFQKKENVFEQSCGGSIIGPQVVISATHCFWDDTGKGKLFPYNQFKVIAGKIYRQYDAIEDAPNAQKRDIIQIFHHET